MVESSYSNGDYITSFSPGASLFAFQSNRSQKNFIDLYPLEDSVKLQVTSSKVLQIDYESSDLQVSDIKLLTWCSSQESKQSVKRKNEEEIENDRTEQFFVNVFPHGKIVIHSGTGKEIINIIQNKKEILGIDSKGDVIWLLDDDKTVKRFHYASTKPLQTFHLTDGKNDDIINFQVLDFPQKLLLAVITEEFVYIIDPSKKRPSTFSKIENFGSISCTVLDDEYVLIADVSKLSLYSLTEKKFTRHWDVESEKVKVSNNHIFVLDTAGQMRVLSRKSDQPIASIKVENSEILDFETKDGSVVLAWIDVNEPKFEVISESQLHEQSEFAFNLTDVKRQASLVPDGGSPKDLPESHQKLTKKEQDETVKQLLLELSEPQINCESIFNILEQPTWNENTIQLVVRDNLKEEDVNHMYDILAKRIADNGHATDSTSIWLKWLLTLRKSQIKAVHSNTNKTTKRLRSTLRTSANSLPTLLSIQGKLEMLMGQSELRKHLATLELNEEDIQIQDGEQDNDEEQDFVYENGEADDTNHQEQ